MNLIRYLSGDAPIVMRMSTLLHHATIDLYTFIDLGKLLLSESEKSGSSGSDIHKRLERAVHLREEMIKVKGN